MERPTETVQTRICLPTGSILLSLCWEPQWLAPEWSLLCGERGELATEIGKTTALSATALSSTLEALQEDTVNLFENLETCYHCCSHSCRFVSVHVGLWLSVLE